MDEFFKQLNAIRQLDDEELTALGSAIVLRELKKGELWAEEGKERLSWGLLKRVI